MTVPKSTPSLKVAIVGGGPGGLGTAIALQTIPNVEVTIYEQASVLREVGAGISIGSNSWKVLELLGVADGVDTGHETWTVLNLGLGRNGQSGQERTKLQSALLSAVNPGTIKLSKKLVHMEDHGPAGVTLAFKDGTTTTVDLVVGADGIRSVVRDIAFPSYPDTLKFTGTTIWRTLLPWAAVSDLDPRFSTTAWWHTPTTHVYFSPVGEGLWEIAARAWHDPKVHSASKVSWGVPVTNEHVESHFNEYLPQIREALSRVPSGGWREFAAFAGPEMPTLTAWSNRIVLVGDSSHALSGAFGSGAGFAMEDGWILAQALAYHSNDTSRALNLFNAIRLPYYAKMYKHLADQTAQRAKNLENTRVPAFDEQVKSKVISDGGGGLDWIYHNNIEHVWNSAIEKGNGELSKPGAIYSSNQSASL
ncbi:hypothetical protein SLS60_006227 [Paraconiothyrium brasiliense]|uniref:FAD-binding domain-containing protein n=1 Tax=Paraconiothyrium brasiliense TaxID=300254 RepID=A0ABR3REF7_9PLEO